MLSIKTASLGEQVFDPDTVIVFPHGIPGFEDCTRFKLFHEEEGNEVVHYLQSLDQTGLAFSVADPSQFHIYYQFVLDDEETSLLEFENPEDLLLLILLYKDEMAFVATQSGLPSIRGSINSPLLINIKSLKGIQKRLRNVEPSFLLTENDSSIEFTAD